MAEKPAALLFHALRGLEARLSSEAFDMSGGDWALVVAIREAARAMSPGSRSDERGIAQRQRMRALIGIEQRAEQLVADCVPYLKPGETPAGRIRREIADTSRMIGVLSKWKRRAEAAEAIVTELRTPPKAGDQRAHVEAWLAFKLTQEPNS